MLRTGIQIPYQTKIDAGFRIVHFGTIVINHEAKIGDDVLIAPNALVNSDVPYCSIAIGNPCKIIRKEKSSNQYIV